MLNRLKTRLLQNPEGLVGRYLLGPLWNRRNAALNEAALEALKDGPGNRLLEVGFGGGRLLCRIVQEHADWELSGVDPSKTMVDYAAGVMEESGARRKPVLRPGRAEAIPFDDNSFDQVVSVNSVFYWNDARKGFDEIHRVLSPGGLLVLCLTKKQSLMVKGLDQPGMTLYEEDEIRELLSSTGFSNIRIESLSDRYREFLKITARKA